MLVRPPPRRGPAEDPPAASAPIGSSRFAAIPPGWVIMGSDAEEGQADERPAHRVWVDAFGLALFPVTRAEYALFLAATRHHEPREWTTPAFTQPDLPVVGVSWHDAQAYCAWRSSLDDPVSLPTEAQWERAARGRHQGRRYPTGDTIPAWVPAGGQGPLDAPWPVGAGDPNDFGLFGMAANIHEWCADWHARDFYARSPALNPTGPASGIRRASRGGAWRHATTISRVAARSKLDPSFRYTDYGFRLAGPARPAR